MMIKNNSSDCMFQLLFEVNAIIGLPSTSKTNGMRKVNRDIGVFARKHRSEKWLVPFQDKRLSIQIRARH